MDFKRKRIFVKIVLSMLITIIIALPSSSWFNFGDCYACGEYCEFIVGYEYINSRYHTVRHWCSECGYDQLAGVDIRQHDSAVGCRYCRMQRLSAPENLSAEKIMLGRGRTGLMIEFDVILTADKYTLVVYSDNIYDPYHFIEIAENELLITSDSYEWFEPDRAYRIRVQALSGYGASLFTEPVVCE